MKLSFLYESKKFVREPREVGDNAEREGQISKTVKKGSAKGSSRGPYKGPLEK